MDASKQRDVTELLLAWKSGNDEALNELILLVYSELRALARLHLRAERKDHTLQPTELTHEVLRRLLGTRQVNSQNRLHFLAVTARLMRSVLVEHARKRREANEEATTWIAFDKQKAQAEPVQVDMIAVHEVLEELEALDPRLCKVVELQYFGGLSTEETAEALGLSPATVKREWRIARAWLVHELKST